MITRPVIGDLEIGMCCWGINQSDSSQDIQARVLVGLDKGRAGFGQHSGKILGMCLGMSLRKAWARCQAGLR